MKSKKYYFHDKNRNALSEDQLIGKKIDDIECFFIDYPLRKLHTHERVFILKKTFFGFVTLKLHLYLNEDTVYDYAILN